MERSCLYHAVRKMPAEARLRLNDRARGKPFLGEPPGPRPLRDTTEGTWEGAAGQRGGKRRSLARILIGSHVGARVCGTAKGNVPRLQQVSQQQAGRVCVPGVPGGPGAGGGRGSTQEWLGGAQLDTPCILDTGVALRKHSFAPLNGQRASSCSQSA